MKVTQIYDKALAHASYIIESNGQIALVDPARDITPYISYANENNSKIIAVFETHPHADFVSSHLELQQKYNAKIYTHPKVGAAYDFTSIAHHEEVKIGDISIMALFTPGHSPDHNAYLLIDEQNKPHALFTGDSLFIGDVGRPDLREGAGHLKVSKKELAGMMYDTINNIFKKLSDDIIVYPAHGPGSLCGKNMSDDLQSTIGREKKENWAMLETDETTFINTYLAGQSFIPKYFPHAVEINREGANSLEESISRIPTVSEQEALDNDHLIIDIRDQAQFKNDHLNNAINIQLGGENSKFETWMGSIIVPNEKFYLVAESEDQLQKAYQRIAKIGYESNITGGLILNNTKSKLDYQFDLNNFKNNRNDYTIIDIRNQSEVEDKKIFTEATNIPLPELRERMDEIPTHKSIVIHCAGGYRSAAGSSIVQQQIKNVEVYDLSEAVNEFS